MAAFDRLSRTEGILPALESAHALAWVVREASQMATGTIVVLNLSGRGDKDVAEVERVKREGYGPTS